MFSKGRNVVTKWLDLLLVIRKTENYTMKEKDFINFSTRLNVFSLLIMLRAGKVVCRILFSFDLYTEKTFFVQNCDILDFVHK